MKPPTAKEREALREHDIFHITLDDDRHLCGAFLVTEVVHTWGIGGWVKMPGTLGVGRFGMTWAHIEPTGGRAAINTLGQPIPRDGAPLRHHP